MPEIPRVEKCCCCCSLNTGGLVLGWMSALGSVLLILITSSTLFVDFDSYVQNNFKNNPEMAEMLMKMKPLVYSAIVISIIIYAVHFICAVFLIRGTLNVSLQINNLENVLIYIFELNNILSSLFFIEKY